MVKIYNDGPNNLYVTSGPTSYNVNFKDNWVKIKMECTYSIYDIHNDKSLSKISASSQIKICIKDCDKYGNLNMDWGTVKWTKTDI